MCVYVCVCVRACMRILVSICLSARIFLYEGMTDELDEGMADELDERMADERTLDDRCPSLSVSYSSTSVAYSSI